MSHIITAFVRYTLTLNLVNLKHFCNNKECVFVQICYENFRRQPKISDTLKISDSLGCCSTPKHPQQYAYGREGREGKGGIGKGREGEWRSGKGREEGERGGCPGFTFEIYGHLNHRASCNNRLCKCKTTQEHISVQLLLT